MRPLAPIPVTSADFDVALIPDGIAAAITPAWVRAANESGFALQCALGADTHWLQPWSVDVWPVHAVTTMHVHPVPLVTPIPPSPWSTLLVTVAQPFERIPGTYPAGLDRQVQNLQSQIATVTNWVIPLDGANHSQVASISPGQHSIGVTFNPSANIISLSAVGNNTGIDYARIQSLAPQGMVMLPVMSGQDTQVTLTVSTVNVGGSATGTVTAIFDAETFTVSPQQPANVATPQLNLATYSIPQNTTTSKVLAVPTGVMALAISTPTSIDSHFVRASIIGNTSLTTYWTNTNPAVFNNPVVVPVNPGLEASYTITFQYSAAGPAGSVTWLVAGLLGTQVVYSVPTFAYYNYPPPAWQAPTLSAVSNGDVFGTGVTIHKVSGVAGQSIFVFDYRFVFDAAGACEFLLQDTAGNRIDSGFSNGAGNVCLQGNAGGRQMAQGAGLDYIQQAAVAGNLWGHVHYTLA